ncbi:hypothetical protein GCM10009863_57320 [Streptomyces axinellae]|uniref:Glutamine--fructose-6-phosphate aminotransferase [isomerizing] n=1 Tax=Streptomyces axinellae TaxID=552788 RepID=A0ABN3QRW9_9ACTN
MCGIVGYLGGQSALDVVLVGLQRLAQEAAVGCSSAGVAVLADGQLAAAKCAGALPGLHEELARRPLPSAGTAIGHFRRAGQGRVSDTADAHPHLDSAGRVAVVQGGTLDSRSALRAELGERGRGSRRGRGHAVGTDTDTGAVAQLLAEAFSSCGDLAEAVRQVCRRTAGSFTLVAVHADDPDAMVGACRAAPLVAGWGDGDGDGEFVLASDAAVFEDGVGALCGVREVVELGRAGRPGRELVVELRRAGGMTVTDFEGAAAGVGA